MDEALMYNQNPNELAGNSMTLGSNDPDLSQFW